MAQIRGFKGWLYNKEKIKDFSKVITPPNDVISEKERIEFAKDKFNFVHLILPQGDGDKYENASKLFKRWKEEGILVRDKDDTIYVYSQSFSFMGKEFSRLGFIALMKLEELGKGMLAHEKVLEKDLNDRISLISTTRSNLEIPFILYDDRQKVIDEVIKNSIRDKHPHIKFTDHKGVTHILWKVTDLQVCNKLSDEMAKYQCVIADGHHRYTSNLKVREMLKSEGANFTLLCFINSFNEGTLIMPTNRVIFGLDDPDINEILNKLKRNFEIEEVGKDQLIRKIDAVEVMIDKTINLKNHVFGVYCNLNKKAYFLTLRNNAVLEHRLADKTDIYRKLDITILHKLIIEDILGITEEQQKRREHIDFVRGNEETWQTIEENDLQFAFFVKPPLMREVFLIARAGETTPQKTTCFYPKVFSGLVVYDFEDLS